MKTLKVEHAVAEKIQTGKITTTLRLYDDKNLSVDDVVALVDKCDSSQPARWKMVGTIRIESVIQTKLRDLVESDYLAAGLQGSSQEALATLHEYYGAQVSFDTPVKVIRFNFNNDDDVHMNTTNTQDDRLRDVDLYADGGSRGNPGPSAAGYVIQDRDGNIVVKNSTYLGITTNNQAEYLALKLGLEEAVKMQVLELNVYMDSMLVINQTKGIFKVRNRDLWPIHAAVMAMLPRFKRITFTQIPRELNRLADKAVNEALDEAEARRRESI